jgi:hypothetical protein
VNRYRVIGKLLIRDAVEAGDLEEIVVTDPKSLTGGLPQGVRPKHIEDYTVHLQCRGPAPSSGESPEPTETPITLTLDDSDEGWGIGGHHRFVPRPYGVAKGEVSGPE